MYTQDSVKRWSDILEGKVSADPNKKSLPFTQWKPSLNPDNQPKDYNIRIMPYDGGGLPIQVVDYYTSKNLSPSRLVTPVQFGLPDPVSDFVKALGRLETALWKKIVLPLKPASRYYIPVYVREEAEKGVQVWEVGKDVFKQIIDILGGKNFQKKQMTDPNNGNDFFVTITLDSFPGADGKSVPYKKAKLEGNVESSKLHENASEQKKLIASIPNLKDIFKAQVKSYEEIKDMVEVYTALTSKGPSKPTGLSPIDEALGKPTTSTITSSTSTEDTLKAISDEFEGL